MSKEQLKWLAGLLEGEGYFTLHKKYSIKKGVRYPYQTAAVRLAMDDSDTVLKASKLMGGYTLGPYFRSNRPPNFRAEVEGRKAIALMRNLYPYMGARRQARISAVLRRDV